MLNSQAICAYQDGYQVHKSLPPFFNTSGQLRPSGHSMRLLQINSQTPFTKEIDTSPVFSNMASNHAAKNPCDSGRSASHAATNAGQTIAADL